MTRISKFILPVFLFFMVLQVAGQKRELIFLQKQGMATSQQQLMDSTDLDMKGLEQMEKMESTNGGLTDNPLSLEKRKTGFNLLDNAQAARFDSLWKKELRESNALSVEMYSEISELDTSRVEMVSLDTEVLKQRLELMNEKSPLNIAYNPSLENVIKSFLTRKKDLMERMLMASQFYFPLFEQELANYDIPLEIKYLAIIESALNPRARSRVGATGLWQFMYGTGKMYDLEVNSYVDERSDPIKSTKAACQYLSRLYEIFGDWDLALAAYNSGPGNVNKAIRRSGGYKNYWNIRNSLPRETAGYVPAFLATMYLFEYAEEHGLITKKIERPYFETDTIHIKQLITFDQISQLLGISVEELVILNPSYKLNIIPKVTGRTYSLRLPMELMGKFVANEDAIYAHVEQEFKSKESPLPQLVQEQDRIQYKVRSGDYLGRIASRYGVGVSQIKQWNGLKSNNLRVGQRLTIFPRTPVTQAVAISTKSSGTSTGGAISDASKIHTVNEGDTLWTISRKYPGITIENLREWNGISGNNLKPGTKLKLCNCSS